MAVERHGQAQRSTYEVIVPDCGMTDSQPARDERLQLGAPRNDGATGARLRDMSRGEE